MTAYKTRKNYIVNFLKRWYNTELKAKKPTREAREPIPPLESFVFVINIINGGSSL